MFYTVAKWLTYFYIRIAFRMRYEGTENIPRDKGFLLVANHRSNHDPIFLAHSIHQPIHYMAKVELFRSAVARWVLKKFHAFPVTRGSSDMSAMRTAKDIVLEGGVLGIFPEGTRSRDGKVQRAKAGAALIAGQTGADVLPCAICFGERLRFRTPVTVRYGELMTAEELGIQPGNLSTVRTASRRMMDTIVEMLEQGV